MILDGQLIRELFSSDKHSSLGVYEVSCFKNGQLTKVIVDDLIPCSPSTGKPCYAHVNVEGEGEIGKLSFCEADMLEYFVLW